MNPFHFTLKSRRRRRRREHCGAWRFQRERVKWSTYHFPAKHERGHVFVLENEFIFDPAWAAPIRLCQKVGISQHQQAK